MVWRWICAPSCDWVMFWRCFGEGLCTSFLLHNSLNMRVSSLKNQIYWKFLLLSILELNNNLRWFDILIFLRFSAFVRRKSETKEINEREAEDYVNGVLFFLSFKFLFSNALFLLPFLCTHKKENTYRNAMSFFWYIVRCPSLDTDFFFEYTRIS